MNKTLIVGNWKTDHETNLRFFSSRREVAKPLARATLFPKLKDAA
ncbi:MAG TPA: hypothetical protein VM124_01810 [Candidatus Limnocylindrales bacterium]|nr:hypothetical protein [Candidatus Limnocylindrales bacterium]